MKKLHEVETAQVHTHTHIGRRSLHFTDRMLEFLVVCSSYSQLVTCVVLDRFRDVRKRLTELPYNVPKVTLHNDLDVDVRESVHL